MNFKIVKYSGWLGRRDSSYEDFHRRLRSGDIIKQEQSLREIMSKLEKELAELRGKYVGHQGATITPEPLWKVVIKSVRRKVGQIEERSPTFEDNKVIVRTAETARQVKGTGSSKSTWRNIGLEGEICVDNLFCVITSRYLLPFIIIHRYLAVLPAEVSSEGKIRIFNLTLDHFTARDNECAKLLERWISSAQSIWRKKKREKQPEYVADWVNMYRKLESQIPNSIRVVWMSRRKLYAAVLNPTKETIFGFPFNKILLKWMLGNRIIEQAILPSGNRTLPVVCDNMLHYVNVESENEAYWLSGIFNSIKFREIVEGKAGLGRGRGPPDIYNIPIRVLNERIPDGFNKTDPTYIKIAELSKELERKIGEMVRSYILHVKGKLNEIKALDDTIDPETVIPNIPANIIFNYLRGRFPKSKKAGLNKIKQFISDREIKQTMKIYELLNNYTSSILM